MDLYEVCIHGKFDARLIVNYLLNESRWFEIEPLPDDDLYAVRVMPVNKIMLDNRLNEIETERETCDRYRKYAIENYNEEGETEVEENAIVSISPDGGAYVETWTWIADWEIGLSDPLDAGDDENEGWVDDEPEQWPPAWTQKIKGNTD